MQGARDCCKKFGAAIIGGDIDHHQELTVVTTGMGLVESGHLVRRMGAKPGDLVCITEFRAGHRHTLTDISNSRKSFSSRSPGLPRGSCSGRAGASAMMDDSDGIALSLYDLMSVNDCGFSLDLAKVPRQAGVPDEQAIGLALYGGGDYELVFTLPPSKHPVKGLSYSVIG